MIHGHVQNVLVMETNVRRRVGHAAVVADLNAFAFGPQNHALRILLVNDDRVDHPISRCQALPFRSFVRGLPQAAGRSRVQRICMLRILLQQLCAAEHERNSAVARPLRAAVHAVINARARRCVNVVRIRGVNHDAHHVGVIDHTLADRKPRLAAVHRLPRQVKRSGINNVLVPRIKRHGVEVLQVVVLDGSNSFPRRAVVHRAIYARERSRHENVLFRG